MDLVRERAPRRILLLEDDAPVRTLMRGLLERQGYAVVSAGDADEALTQFDRAELPFHLLISDVLLPNQQRGYQVAWRLTERDPSLRVLLVSGYAAAADDLAAALDAERGAFLEKPFEPAHFLTVVGELLN